MAVVGAANSQTNRVGAYVGVNVKIASVIGCTSRATRATEGTDLHVCACVEVAGAACKRA